MPKGTRHGEMEGDDLRGGTADDQTRVTTGGKQTWYLNVSLLKFEDMNMDIF